MRQSFSVPFEYDVTFTRDAFAPDNGALLEAFTRREPARRHRVLPIVDSGLAAAYPELPGWLTAYFTRHAERLELVAPPALVVGGEAAKNDPQVVARLHALFHEHHLDRHSFALVVGGGAVQDAAGFAAATCHRGLRTVRVPTTVLSQNDSGVGVKNGVNLLGSKNFVGSFAPPFAVVNDARFLERLPRRDRLAGLAEVIKVALIRDGAFFASVEADAGALAALDLDATEEVVRRCAALHLRHIATGGDPFELGSARPLDFGHWTAHKLESMTAHELRHGEAVAIGIVLDSRYAALAGLLAEADFTRIHAVVRRLGLPSWHDALAIRAAGGRLAVLDGLREFREHLGGELTVTLVRGIGHALEVHEMDAALVEEAIVWMRAAATSS
ncbi:MAG TPA: 3-dehydroquinate synthase [Polyangia bacterium]|nr:3-dehydroquinate synthase [Polyangia bacterium]